MKIYEWKPGLTDQEMKDGAYWERNMLALNFADGWYYDLVNTPTMVEPFRGIKTHPRYEGWSRVLSLADGKMTFHIPDDFDVGNLKYLGGSNWDGHTTREKWQRVMAKFGIEET